MINGIALMSLSKEGDTEAPRQLRRRRYAKSPDVNVLKQQQRSFFPTRTIMRDIPVNQTLITPNEEEKERKSACSALSVGALS